MQPSTSSGSKTSDTAILAQPGKLTGVILNADGSNSATAVLYDSKSAASGTVLARLQVPSGSAHLFEDFTLLGGVVANNGIYLDISGTGASCIVYYQPG